MISAPAALLVTTDAAIVPLEYPANSDEHLTVLRAVMLCDRVDVVALTDQLDMWIDDEGLYRQPINPAATVLAQLFGFTHQPYHGPVVLTGGADGNGDTIALTPEKLKALISKIEA